jgi:hypothetical protein
MLAALALALASPANAAVDPPTPYVYTSYVHAFAGMGAVPGAHTPFFVTTIDVGRHPFGGAFSAGVSGSFASDPSAGWMLGAFGVQLRLDLTYLFLSGFWAERFDPCFPIHIQLGARLGAALSEATALHPSYWLARFELQPELDVEVPLGRRRVSSVIVRGALDSSMSLDGLFRWSILVGYGFAWGQPK